MRTRYCIDARALISGVHREIVKRIDMWGLDMVFVVGGNGGNAGANAIQVECAKQDVTCCVVGIPKSIDNDILLVRASCDDIGHHQHSCLL